MIAIVVLLLILALAGGGFALNALWYVAAVVLLLWLLGFAFGAPGPGGGPRRWYRW